MTNIFNRTMRSEPGGIQGIIDICNYVSKTKKVKNILEIGSYKGESTTTFAKFFPFVENIFAVDPFSLNYNSDSLFNKENLNYIEEYFLNNIKNYPVIKHLKLSSLDAAKNFKNEYFDFIYIDGCHLKECVIEDATTWIPKVNKNGYISFHDIDNIDVQNALSNFFDLKLGFITIDNSITFKV